MNVTLYATQQPDTGTSLCPPLFELLWQGQISHFQHKTSCAYLLLLLPILLGHLVRFKTSSYTNKYHPIKYKSFSFLQQQAVMVVLMITHDLQRICWLGMPGV
jgi:hypothetical protein